MGLLAALTSLQGKLEKSLDHLQKQMEDALLFQAQAEETCALWQAGGWVLRSRGGEVGHWCPPLLDAAVHTNAPHNAALLLQTLNPRGEFGRGTGGVWSPGGGFVAPSSLSPLCPLQKMVESQRQNVRAEFERLRRLLAEEEQRLLQRLEEEELEVLPPLQESAVRLGQQSAQLADLVAELEGRCQLPALGLLQVSTCLEWAHRGSNGKGVQTREQEGESPWWSKLSELVLFWMSCVLPVTYWGEDWDW